MKKFVLVSLTALAACPQLALAQSSESKPSTNAPTRLPEVVVRDTGTGGSLTVPSAQQAEQALRAVPGGVDVIAAEEYKTGRASTMKDVLQWSPGVFIQERFGAEEARLSIRGSGLQRTFHGRGLKLMQDGVPLNLADGGFDMQSVEPLSVSYVEVFRGANALSYGSTTLGGAVNFVAPTGYDAAKLQLRGEGGSFGYARGQVSSGLVEGRADYYVSATHFSQDGFRVHSDQSAQRVFANAGFRVNDHVETRLYYTYVLTDSELPGSIFKADLEANPRRANDYPTAPGAVNNLTGDQHRDFDLHRVASKTTWRNDHHRLDLSAFWSHKDLFHPIFQVIDQNSNDLGLDLRYVNSADWLGRRNQLTAGLYPTLGWVENAQFVNAGGVRGPMTLQNFQSAQNLDFYLENSHWLNDKFALVLGAQISYANRDLEGIFASPTFRQDYFGVNPKMGFTYEAAAGVQLYGNVSRSMEPPSFSEMGNVTIALVPTFVPRAEQTAWTFELGTRGERGRFAWDVAGYHALLDGELLTLTLPGGGGAASTINAEDTTHSGVELGASWRLWEGIPTGEGRDGDALTARVSYQWSRFRFAGDANFGDNTIAGIPEHFTRFELLYTHPCGFYFGPNAEWSAIKTPIDHANTFFADPYGLLGLKAGWRGDRWSLFVEARNLTDKRYAATTGVLRTAAGADAAQFLPGDGRAFYGGLEWKW